PLSKQRTQIVEQTDLSGRATRCLPEPTLLRLTVFPSETVPQRELHNARLGQRLRKLAEIGRVRQAQVVDRRCRNVEAHIVENVESFPAKLNHLGFRDFPGLTQPGVDLEKARSAQFVPLTGFTRKRETEGIYCITEIAEHVGITLRVPESSGMNRGSLDGRGSQLPIGTPEAQPRTNTEGITAGPAAQP